MAQFVYVVTHLEMGWDCVCGVYTDYRKAVESCYWDDERAFEEKEREVENGDTCYVIHHKKLEQ
jgi:hypothetical protein